MIGRDWDHYPEAVSSQPHVAFNDLTSLAQTTDRDALLRVLESGWLILGNEVREFERAWAARCGVEDAVGVGNGLDAIEIGLRALGIGPGDEVITTPMTAVATVLGVLRAGATPVLADIDPDTALLDMRSVERCVTPKTRAVLLVHLYGQVRNMERWSTWCQQRDLVLLEDCAQSHDACEANTRAGSWGAFGAFSFYPTKNLGAAGDAGALVTSDAQVAETARSLRNYGQSNRYEHPLAGLNSRLDEMQAAILSARLPRLAGWTQRRQAIADLYRAGIDNPAVSLLAPPLSRASHVHHLFVVLSPQRDDLQQHLASAGVETLIHYPIPAHRQPSLAGLRRDPMGLAAAEEHAMRCLSLPCAPHLSDEEVHRVIDAVNAFTH